MIIGDIIWRLAAKCDLLFTGPTATAACGNRNICAGLGLGIEGAVHANLAEYGKDLIQATDSGEVKAKSKYLLAHTPTPEMPALSQGDDTVDDLSREVSVELLVERMTLLTQLLATDIPDLSQGD